MPASTRHSGEKAHERQAETTPLPLSHGQSLHRFQTYHWLGTYGYGGRMADREESNHPDEGGHAQIDAGFERADSVELRRQPSGGPPGQRKPS